LAQEVIEVPITGKVLSLEVSVGDSVGEGDIVCFVESMKMENPILTPVAGKVAEIKVAKGDAVEVGATIAIIEY
jgi:biotin carboxyl carrier protein